jgi:hypothetical protein
METKCTTFQWNATKVGVLKKTGKCEQVCRKVMRYTADTKKKGAKHVKKAYGAYAPDTDFGKLFEISTPVATSRKQRMQQAERLNAYKERFINLGF